MVAKAINLTFRALQFLWTLLIMALVGNSIAMAEGGSPSMLNYVMFTAVFSMLTLFYLIPATAKEGLQGHAIVPLTLDVLNAIFFFCAAIALAAKLHVHSCNNVPYLDTTGVINFANPGDRTEVCREDQANTAFLWFGWAAYMGSVVISGMGLGGSGVSMRGGAGGIRRGPPAMSQV